MRRHCSRAILIFLGLLLRFACAKLPTIHTRNSIFFLHTSAEEKISDIARCSIESAARKNPGRRIVVYSNGWPVRKISIIHPNVYVTRYNVSEILEDYPFFLSWYHSSKWKQGFPIVNLADALRLVILHQSQGGTYMDLDMLSFQSLGIVGDNAIGVETMHSVQKSPTVDSDKFTVNSAILANFNENSTYLASLLRNFLNDFAGARWGHNTRRQGKAIYMGYLKLGRHLATQ